VNKRLSRPYRSPLREDQTEATALRIVEAALVVLEDRPAELSIPAVARAARVSVPTVYRHFADKAALVRAVSQHLDRNSGLPAPGPWHSPAAIAEHVREVFPRLNGRRALLRPAFASAEGAAVRRAEVAERVAAVRRALDGGKRRLAPADQDRLVSIITVLCTSETLGLLQEYLGLSGAEAGEAVGWAIDRLSADGRP
jgi:AcrR family transcriptional regulator